MPSKTRKRLNKLARWETTTGWSPDKKLNQLYPSLMPYPYKIIKCYYCKRRHVDGWGWATIGPPPGVNVCMNCGPTRYMMQEMEDKLVGAAG